MLISKQEQIIKLEKERLEQEVKDSFEKKLHERLKDLVETEAKFRKKMAELNQQNQGSNKMIEELTARNQELQGDRDDLHSTKVELYKMLQAQSIELEELRTLKQLSESKKTLLQLDAVNKEKEKLEREIKLLTREKTKLEDWKKRKENPSLAEQEFSKLQKTNDALIEALGAKAQDLFFMEEQNKRIVSEKGCFNNKTNCYENI